MMARNDEKNSWDYPLALPRKWVKRFAKQGLGEALALLLPAATRRIEKSGAAHTLIERVIVAGLISRHRRAGTLESLAHFHGKFWADKYAVDVHGENAARFDATVGLNEDLIAAVVGKIEQDRFDRLCEFGCGPGKLLSIIAARVTKPATFIGIDLSAEQTARNVSRSGDERVAFVTSDALAWAREHASERTLYVTYGGVLEYFTEQGVKDLFVAVAKQKPACFALAEPIARDFDLAAEDRSRAFGDELSFSHNYPRLLAEAGFRIEWQTEVSPGFRWLKLVAVLE